MTITFIYCFLGYLLSYQANDRQNWENVELESEVEIFEIKQLQCGTEYQIYVQAISSVGYSKPSQTLNVKTKGTGIEENNEGT